jgi:hypothetical protein
MLAARLVGLDGEVVGVERDPAAGGIRHGARRGGRLLKCAFRSLDAVVGRLVLMFAPDPLWCPCTDRSVAPARRCPGPGATL